jgi:hypothetical protein
MGKNTDQHYTNTPAPNNKKPTQPTIEKTDFPVSKSETKKPNTAF